MPRPRKHRRLLNDPLPVIYKPVGISLASLDRVTLFYEELEALRLADLEGQHQADAADHMAISRSTFQRIIAEARRKVALALVKGTALYVEGGTFRVASISYRCASCDHTWAFVHGSGQGPPETCPVCQSSAIGERTAKAQSQEPSG